jgi:hypothetical protein
MVAADRRERSYREKVQERTGQPPAASLNEQAAAMRSRLSRIHYRPALINGFLAQTGLTLELEPP